MQMGRLWDGGSRVIKQNWIIHNLLVLIDLACLPPKRRMGIAVIPEWGPAVVLAKSGLVLARGRGTATERGRCTLNSGSVGW